MRNTTRAQRTALEQAEAADSRIADKLDHLTEWVLKTERYHHARRNAAVAEINSATEGMLAELKTFRDELIQLGAELRGRPPASVSNPPHEGERSQIEGPAELPVEMPIGGDREAISHPQPEPAQRRKGMRLLGRGE